MNNPAHHTVAVAGSPETRAVLAGLRAVSAAQFQAVPASPSRVIATACWLLEMVVEGALEINAEGRGWRRREVATGVLYAPGSSYRERATDPRRPRGYTSLYVFFGDAGGELPRLLTLAGRFAWVEDSDRVLAPLLRDIVTGLEGGPAAAVSATGSLYHVVARLLAAELRRDTLVIGSAAAGIPDMIAALHRYMRENLAGTIRLRDLAACVGLSESALSHAYRRIAGRTPMAALRAFRVEAAKLHLIRGRLTLEAIAGLTGFADAFHLSRTFKTITGMTPREFRR